ncbi:MAG: ABC transporter permease, partial [Lachnospiraceae bacterium]|nr:ABC transporter permease [Lachnospiraceae bacterium]
MNIAHLLNAMPGTIAQGLIWGITAIGIYITYRILDFADLTVDGSLCTGGAVCIMMMLSGHNVFVSMFVATLAGMLTGLATGLFHTFMGIPPILSGILTQLGLYSVNLEIMGKANQAINVDKYNLLVSLRYIKNVAFYKNTIFIVA